MNTKLIKFYTDGGTDSEGRTIADLHKFSHHSLEDRHDYIQWLLPTRTVSRCNRDAPILDDLTVVTLRGNNTFRHNFRVSMHKMYLFWMSYDHWHQPGDHNLMRITRFIESGVSLGEERLVGEFMLFLYELADRTDFITAKNLRYFVEAAIAR